MEFRTCTINDISSAVALSRRVFKDNMGEQFVRLFGIQNKDRMFVAVDEHQTVRSLLCYYPSTVHLDGVSILVGSIGSVCTDEAFRGRGLASRLLKSAYAKMNEENIPVSVISGGGGIYEASGATLTGSMVECRIEKERMVLDSSTSIRPVQEADLAWMCERNQSEPVRFDRTLEEFVDLYRGQTVPDTFATYPAWIVEREGQKLAYAVGILEHGKDELGLKEYAGDREALSLAFPAMLDQTGRNNVHFAAVPGDSILSIPHLIQTPTTQHASLRINDPVGFLKAMEPLALRNGCLDDQAMNIRPDGAGWVIAWRDKELRFSDLHELNRFVFGAWKPSTKRGSTNLQTELSKLFPVRFPWTHNLNYQ